MQQNVPDRSHSTPLSVEFGAAIRARRRTVGLSQSELAFAIGTDRRVVGRLERGIGTVRLEIALAAAHALGVDVLSSMRDKE